MFDIERVYVQILFWTNIIESLEMRQFEILSTHWNKSMIDSTYKILVVFHNIRSKLLFNSRQRT